MANNTEITHLSISKTKVNMAARLPTERSTFVVPALPLPMVRISSLLNIFVEIMEKLMLPSKYDTIIIANTGSANV